MILAEVDGYYALANEQDAKAMMDIMNRARKVKQSYYLPSPNRFYYADMETSITISLHNFDPMTEQDAIEIINAETVKRAQENPA